MEMESRDQQKVFGDSPPEKVFFQVVIDYETFLHREIAGVIPEDEWVRESEPIANFPEALETAHEVALKVGEKFSDSRVVEVDDDELEQADGFLFFVMDEEDLIIAGITVETVDYREETIH